MEQIVLKQIKKQQNSIEYRFSVTEGLKKYFTEVPFRVEYSIDGIEKIPDGIVAIPFVSNVLPIIWLSNSELVVNELDKAFLECLPNLKKGYETMFPESKFRGKITVNHVLECDIPSTGKSAVFFSGGLDATHTLVRHMDEKPDLLTVWGSDIRYDNEEGWNTMNKGILESAAIYGLNQIVIRSSFRAFDREDVLGADYSKKLKDGWWHGVKHGIGLLGHAAPLVYLKGLSQIYIASTNCPADGHVRCASNPLTDNQVRFAGCRVVHDGFECSRQDKVRDVVDFHNQTNIPLLLHVCWQTQSGSNCCHCEKCYRTIAGILAEGADPAEYGFDAVWETLNDMESYLYNGGLSPKAAREWWLHIQNRVLENGEKLEKLPHWNQISWLATTNFAKYRNRQEPLNIRIREKLSHFRFYQFLHRMKEKHHG